MKTCMILIAAGAVLTATAVASAGPIHVHQQKKAAGGAPGFGVLDNAFSDNFDSYAAGSQLVPQGGWTLWPDPASRNAFVDNTRASSAPNSIRIERDTDIAQAMDLTSGKWRFTAKTYFPSTNVLTEGFIIVMNTYPPNPPTNWGSWSAQIAWRPSWGTVSINYDDPTNTGVPIVYDQWVDVKVEVDLDNDKYSAWYNGVQFVNDREWSTGSWPTGGVARLQAWTFFGFGGAPEATAIYFDDMVFEAMGSTCYANCDGSTTPPILNVEDFTCFINQFAAGSQLPHAQQLGHYANCDQSTTAPVLNVEDFTCFINRFAQGCP
jgi:hypothetical protein